MHACPAQRVDAQTQTGASNGVHVDDVFQVGDVGIEVVMTVSGVGLERLFQAYTGHADDFLGQQFVGLVLDPLGDIGVSRAAVGWVVFEAAAFRRVVRR